MYGSVLLNHMMNNVEQKCHLVEAGFCEGPKDNWWSGTSEVLPKYFFKYFTPLISWPVFLVPFITQRVAYAAAAFLTLSCLLTCSLLYSNRSNDDLRLPVQCKGHFPVCFLKHLSRHLMLLTTVLLELFFPRSSFEQGWSSEGRPPQCLHSQLFLEFQWFFTQK